jgi:hypothetical protein
MRKGQAGFYELFIDSLFAPQKEIIINKSIINNSANEIWKKAERIGRQVKTLKYWDDLVSPHLEALGVNISLLNYYRKTDTVRNTIYGEYKCNTCGHIWKRRPKPMSETKKPCDHCEELKKQENYIKAFQEIHGIERYLYLDWRYTKGQQEVLIYCPVCCHEWWSLTNNHKGRKAGCEPCSQAEKNHTLADCIRLGENKHNNKCTYLELFIDAKGVKRLRVLCPKHGEFTPVMNTHLNVGGYCPKCVNEQISIDMQNGSRPKPPINPNKTTRKDTQIKEEVYNRYTLETCIRIGNEKHRNKYKYLHVYINDKGQSMLLIKCPTHGIFSQQLRYHLGCNHGCIECGKSGVDSTIQAERNKEEYLQQYLQVYTLYCFDPETGENFFKIGVTKNSVKERYSSYSRLPYCFQIVDFIETNKYNGLYLEEEVHNNHYQYNYRPNKDFGGSATECFSHVTHIDLEQINFDELTIYNNKRKEK